MIKTKLYISIFEVGLGFDAQEKAIKALIDAISRGAYFLPLSPRLSNQEKERIKKKISALPLSAFDQIELKSKKAGGLFILTSGSSSFPKIAFHLWEGLIESAKTAAKALDLQKEDLWHMSLPLWHIGGVMAALRCYYVGALMTKEADQTTFTSWVGTHLYRLIKKGTKPPTNLKCALIGGGPVSQELLKKGKTLGYPVKETYGLTEMGAMVSLEGKILPGKEVKIDPSTQEILVKGEGLFEGYIDLESIDTDCVALSAESEEELEGSSQILKKPFTKEGWFCTGDLGKIDSAGNLHILGRKDNLFISGGENIQPEEIERTLNEHPDVLESVVVAVADEEYGRRPAAFIRLARDANVKPSSSSEKIETFLEESLKAYLVEHLAKFKVPVLWFYWPKSMQGALKPKRAEFKRLLDLSLMGS